jgi:hypothetical protein
MVISSLTQRSFSMKIINHTQAQTCKHNHRQSRTSTKNYTPAHTHTPAIRDTCVVGLSRCSDLWAGARDAERPLHQKHCRHDWRLSRGSVSRDFYGAVKQYAADCIFYRVVGTIGVQLHNTSGSNCEPYYTSFP